MKRQKILVIVGPTASGKTALGIELAKKFAGEIISADSRQVYRGLDIGTGKVTKREMRGVPHYLLDIASPKRTVTAHEFATKARRAIRTIAASGSLPIIVGGTGFYIDTLLGRISLPDVPPNPAFRKRLQKKTAAHLYALLKKKDPRRAKSMDTPSERNNKVRLIRALEIAVAGKPRAELPKAEFDVLWIGISPKESALEERIMRRLKARMKIGMLAEATRLHKQGLSFKRMEELGLEYRALARLQQKKIDRKQFDEELFREIRRYAKRQIVYWKRNTEVHWYDPRQKTKIASKVASWLKVS
ncbi:MAG: tRNA (adenosine(37)-N6)-dimethylallyltransferase MiaA [Candidatus Pacebacteria bacterium]|nr:tRNA (adenosine(37)-N6)-dimethylallyltransferase MiaA [Candidatus Paceibacterota bacterium]